MSDVANDEHDEQLDEQIMPLDVDPEETGPAEEHDESSHTPATPELDPEIEREIKKVIIEEEPAKVKMLPSQLIEKDLEPDDLFDPGSI
ncbi:MAG: hypothetical protein WCO52_03245 [bacterium]